MTLGHDSFSISMWTGEHLSKIYDMADKVLSTFSFHFNGALYYKETV